jgi:ATP phosphoribosyltransferase regulatory subunit
VRAEPEPLLIRPRAAFPDGADALAVRLPRGVRDYLPEAAARRRDIAEAVLAEAERWGYRRIITPAFEYEAVLSRGLGARAQAQAVRFVEPGTGEVVMLRPDITPQVARLVATRLGDEPGPLRLAYEGAVVRLAHGGQRELFQAGVELIDPHAPSPEASCDVELIALAAAALKACGVSEFVLDLGSAPVAQAALDGLAGPAGEALRSAIARKDQDEVERLTRALALPPWRARLLAALPSLYGGAEVIERAQSLLHRAPAASAREGLAALAEIARRLGAWKLERHVSVDLGEVRGFDYYTGVRFSGYAPGVGDALLSGGRYDALAARYGRAAAAAGFAVDVERVALALPAEEPLSPSGVFLAGAVPARHLLAQALRAAGERVVEDLDDGVAPAAQLAARARHAGAERALVLDSSGAVRWLDGAGDDAGTIPRGRVDAFIAAPGCESLDAIRPPRYPAGPPRPAAARRGKQ